MSVEKAERKRRLTNKEIKNFAIWAINNEVYNKYNDARIRQLYFKETNIDISISTIKKQKGRWIKINDEIYDVNKPWTLPKKESSD